MIAALAFLRSPVGRYLLIALSVVVAFSGAYLTGRRDQHKKDAVELQKVKAADALALNTCHGNVSTLQAAIERQNSAVEAIGAESRARVAQSQKQASAARAVAESFRQEAAGIMKAKVGVDACASADQLVLESVR